MRLAKSRFVVSEPMVVLLAAVVVLLAFDPALPTYAQRPTDAQRPTTEPKSLDPDRVSTKLHAVVQEWHRSHPEFPGAVAAIVHVERPLQLAAVGVRKIGDAEPITPDDKMHLGSCTKAMTATLIARLVEQDKLDWETTIAEALPELAKQIHPDYGSVTVTQLLMHQAGMPANAKSWWLRDGENLHERRQKIALHSLADPPEHEPGSKYLYSNLGYMVAGLMAETVANHEWEVLMRDELFEPLGLRSAGFGPPSTGGQLDQPWGHKVVNDKTVPMQFDNAPALGPAGTVHMSFADWAKFCLLHAVDDYEPGFLRPETFKTLHTPPENAGYALGWNIAKRGWAKGITLSHSGSNTMWYCTVWVAPNRKSAFLVGTNVARDDAHQALDELVVELLKLEGYLK